MGPGVAAPEAEGSWDVPCAIAGWPAAAGTPQLLLLAAVVAPWGKGAPNAAGELSWGVPSEKQEQLSGGIN